jgi:hypothetical protein
LWFCETVTKIDCIKSISSIVRARVEAIGVERRAALIGRPRELLDQLEALAKPAYSPAEAGTP